MLVCGRSLVAQICGGSGADGFTNEKADDPAVLAVNREGGGNNYLRGCVGGGLATKPWFLASLRWALSVAESDSQQEP